MSVPRVTVAVLTPAIIHRVPSPVAADLDTYCKVTTGHVQVTTPRPAVP